MKIFTLCKKYLLQHKYQLSVYVTITLLATAISILSPYIIGNFLDNLIEGGDVGVILRFCAIFGGLSALRIVKNYVTSIMYVKMHVQMGYSFNSDIIKHIQNLSLSYINNKDSAYLNQRVNSDANSLIGFCISMMQSILTNVVMLVVPFILLLHLNWFIAVLLVGFLAVYMVAYFAFKKPLYNSGFAFREAYGKFFAGLFEQLKYVKIIKINSIQPHMNRRTDKVFEDYKTKSIHNRKVNHLYSSLDGFISTIAQILLFVVGGLQVLSGDFTIGMLTIFISYFNMMLGSSRYFFGLGASYQQTLVAYDRIKDILDLEPESVGAKVIGDIGKIELCNLSFSYATQEENDIDSTEPSFSSQMRPNKIVMVNNSEVITNLSIKFTKGNIYAIAGANGAGKSTLINLIMGLYIDEYKGCITYDATDIRQIDMVSVRRNLMGFSEQEPALLNDSIWNNLHFDDANAAGTHDDADDATDDTENITQMLDCHIQTLGMQNFISQNGLDFSINEDNNNTSGGEKQKISILKVLYKNPSVMIFDEPTSALDDETTKNFIQYLQQIKKDKIIIIVTHDEFVTRCCDEVVLLM